MGKYEVNRDAKEKLQSMIQSHQYVLDNDWGDSQPSSDEENDFLDRHDWDEYSAWHLAIDTQASEETKDRFGFVVGDFQRVHRSGLIAAKQRAAQHGHEEIKNAADELLEKLESTNRNND